MPVRNRMRIFENTPQLRHTSKSIYLCYIRRPSHMLDMARESWGGGRGGGR